MSWGMFGNQNPIKMHELIFVLNETTCSQHVLHLKFTSVLSWFAVNELKGLFLLFFPAWSSMMLEWWIPVSSLIVFLIHLQEENKFPVLFFFKSHLVFLTLNELFTALNMWNKWKQRSCFLCTCRRRPRTNYSWLGQSQVPGACWLQEVECFKLLAAVLYCLIAVFFAKRNRNKIIKSKHS